MTEMTEAEVAEQEELWHKEMLQIYEDADAIGYEATGFRGLMASHGPLRVAKMLINMDEPSDGFTELGYWSDSIFQSRPERSSPSFEVCSQNRRSSCAAGGLLLMSGRNVRLGILPLRSGRRYRRRYSSLD